MNRVLFILAIIHLILIYNVTAQITVNGKLNSDLKYGIKQLDEIPVINMPEFDVHKLIDEDKENEKNSGKPFDVNINIKKEGLLKKIPNTGKIWHLRIKSKGAYSLVLIFGEYELPPDAELYICNINKTQIVGALTEINNNSSKVVPVQPLKGDEVIIEYFEPNGISFSGNLIVTRIGHDYIGILNEPNEKDGGFGLSQPCNVDINCPEGDNWQNEKQSVCRLLINASQYCTGSLLNNVNNDGMAYVLTANHCINSEYKANRTLFVFNYESPTCSGTDGSVAQSISNSTLRANWSTDYTDFSLVELSSVPPNDFYPYWNGWNRSANIPSAPVVCIHHPRHDVKKIARDDVVPDDKSQFLWSITDWTVGTVEHGSSGAPLYNSNHRVVGQVHDGNNIFCDANEISTYGKFSRSWEGGGLYTSILRNWLDPANTTIELPGLRLIRNGTINTDTPASGDIVRFENVSIQSSSNIIIEFEERFEATGTFSVPIGSTLVIRPL